MREIFFRGKRVDNGEWVYGSPFFGTSDSCKIIFAVALHPDFVDEGYIYYSEGFSVDPATVGQYTGLTDRNGVKIFEGDIIQRKGYIYPLGKQEPCGERIVRGSVLWMDDGRNAGCWSIDSEDEHGNPTTYSFDNSFIVIGNIHDNPELLKKY